MRILHFSDIHFWAFGLDGDLTFKRLLGVANLIARRARQYPSAASRAVLQRILQTDANVVCFTGDVTTSSLRREFQEGREAMQPLLDKWGDRFLDVPGNHDRYTRVATRRQLYEQFVGTGAERAFPYLKTIDGVDFVGIDTARPCFVSSRGAFPPARQQALKQLIASRDGATRPIVMLGHYPYVLPGGQVHRRNHRLEDAPALAAILAELRPALYLHGHVHKRWAHHPAATPATLCVNAGSAGMRAPTLLRQAGFVLIDLDPIANRVHSVTGVALRPRSFDEFEEFALWPDPATDPTPRKAR